jgi:hypothetical protein
VLQLESILTRLTEPYIRTIKQDRRAVLFGLHQCCATGVPPQRFRCAANFYKKLHIRTFCCKKATSYISSSIVFPNMSNVLFSYACILTGQRFVCRYILWPWRVSYPLFVRRNFVVCRHVSLTNQGVPRVKKGCGTLDYTNVQKVLFLPHTA